MATGTAVMTTERLLWCLRMTVSGFIIADSVLCFDWLRAVMRSQGVGHSGRKAVSMFPEWPISAASLQTHSLSTRFN